MIKNGILTLLIGFSLACGKETPGVKPEYTDISESVYASGIVESKNQYQVFANVSGIVDEVYVSEGDTVRKGAPILSLINETSRLMKENAELAAKNAGKEANAAKLNELKLAIDLSKNKLRNDSLLYFRQKNLYAQDVGTLSQLEQRELMYKQSVTEYESLKMRYADLVRQIEFTSGQSQKNLQISRKQENDFIIRSEIDGKVYNLLRKKGEQVGPQTPVAVMGSHTDFIMKLQVDEYDIVRVRPGQQTWISLDSYKGQVFEAVITKVNPMMNERTKTFEVEAVFKNVPGVLFPNLTLEANIVILTKKQVLTLPRNYVTDDGYVTLENGERKAVKTGLKDYQKIEIVSGITANDFVILNQQ